MQFVSQSRVNVIEIAFFLGRSPQSMSIHDVHMYPRAACVHFGDLLKASKSKNEMGILTTTLGNLQEFTSALFPKPKCAQAIAENHRKLVPGMTP